MSIDKFGRHSAHFKHSNLFASDNDEKFLINVRTPIEDSHAVNKQYFDKELKSIVKSFEQKLQTLNKSLEEHKNTAEKNIKKADLVIKQLKNDIEIIYKELKIVDL